MSKENTAGALASIGVEVDISRIDAVTAQELDAETEEDSPDEESDDGPSDQDLEEDEVSFLSDKEDEEATGSEVAADQTMNDEAMQAPKPDKSAEDNFDEAPNDEDFIPGNDNKQKEGKKCDN